jgi:hypothetical protein
LIFKGFHLLCFGTEYAQDKEDHVIFLSFL